MPHRDDERIGIALRALRRKHRMTQQQVADTAGVSRRTVARVENGEAGKLTLETNRRIFAVFDSQFRTIAQWHGAAMDRLLDERHAALVEKALEVLQRRGWRAAVEVTFSVFGERGSIDLLGGHLATRSVLVGEVKTMFGSLEETNRMLDMKERHATQLAIERFGWRPATTSRVLILPEENTLRRIVDRHGRTLSSVYPARGREIRAWLRLPTGRMSGIWFLADGRSAEGRGGRSAEGRDAAGR